MKQYGLTSQYVDVVVADSSLPLWRDSLQFDAIITDRKFWFIFSPKLFKFFLSSLRCKGSNRKNRLKAKVRCQCWTRGCAHSLQNWLHIIRHIRRSTPTSSTSFSRQRPASDVDANSQWWRARAAKSPCSVFESLLSTTLVRSYRKAAHHLGKKLWLARCHTKHSRPIPWRLQAAVFSSGWD